MLGIAEFLDVKIGGPPVGDIVIPLGVADVPVGSLNAVEFVRG